MQVYPVYFKSTLQRFIFKLFLLIGLVFLVQTSNLKAQLTYFDVGISANKPKLRSEAGSLYANILFKPRFTVHETKTSSWTINVPIGLSAANENDGDDGFRFLNNPSFNISTLINYNIGAGANHFTHARLGGYVGGGVGFHVFGKHIKDINPDFLPTSMLCLEFNGGVRIGTNWIHEFEPKYIDIGFVYSKSLASSHTSLTSVQLVLSF